MGNRTSKFFFFLILAVMVVGVNGFIWNNFLKAKPTPKAKTTPRQAPTVAVQLTQDEAQVLAARTADETNLIKLAVYDKSGLDDVAAEWTILTKDLNQASGRIRQRIGGKELFWKATKTGEMWTCVYVGSEQPK